MDNRDAGAQLIQALRNPAVFRHPVGRFEVIETHISWVLLTGEFAFKIKKPVDLGFVDFSSLDKRKKYCDTELRLNRRLCPELYLEVVKITGTLEQPRMGGDGDALEYAVQMREFSQGQLLSQLVAHDNLTTSHIDELAREVAEFHADIPADRDGAFGVPQDIRGFAAGNFGPILEASLEGDADRIINDLCEWSLAEAEERNADFHQRKADGFVRECHGDLHLGNMIVDGDDVRIFDCIEFNEHLRWIDVMSEVAFVVMDLDDRGRPDFAWRFVNKYLEATGDYEGIRVLRFYLVYRALVRAKVAALRLHQGHLPQEDKALFQAECVGYVEQARAYSKRSTPTLIITHGLSGSGKTTGTQKYIEKLGAIRIRSDIERKRLLGLEPLSSTKNQYDGNAYSTKMTLQTYGRLLRLAKVALIAGFSCIIDATFLKRRDRDMFRQQANQLSVPFRIAAFDADSETLRQRLLARLVAGDDASEADLQVLGLQIESFEPLSDDERPLVLNDSSMSHASQ